ncbi:MAG: hypothetical protein ABI541_08095 [Betaproteobacteria bacterium]
MPTYRGSRPLLTRWLFGVALCLLALYVLNIALGMLAVKAGVTTRRVGDVGEFLLVLSCMAFFVAGLVADEKRQDASPDGEDGPHETKGGAQ